MMENQTAKPVEEREGISVTVHKIKQGELEISEFLSYDQMPAHVKYYISIGVFQVETVEETLYFD